MFQRLREGSEAVIAIDGSRFKAVNTRDKNYTHGAIRRRMAQVEASIAERRVKRWEHEAIIDAMQRRLDQAPDIMRIRR